MLERRRYASSTVPGVSSTAEGEVRHPDSLPNVLSTEGLQFFLIAFDQFPHPTPKRLTEPASNDVSIAIKRPIEFIADMSFRQHILPGFPATKPYMPAIYKNNAKGVCR